MMLVELFAPEGALDPRQRSAVAERLLAALTTHEGTPPAVLDATRALFHVVVHEVDAWATGGATATSPHYFVRVHLPGGSMLNDEGRAHYIATITRVLAEIHAEPDRFVREPLVPVHLVEVPPGAFGVLGRPMTEADLVKMVMGSGDASGGPAHPIQPGADTATDPVCGMTVAVSDPARPAITLDHDGATYAFCSGGCRDVFAERLAEAIR